MASKHLPLAFLDFRCLDPRSHSFPVITYLPTLHYYWVTIRNTRYTIISVVEGSH